MAPEQFFGGSIDERTDQFSFCVVLYRALYGTRPFPGKTFEELGEAVAHGQLQEMPKAIGVPRRIQLVLRKGLSTSREDRYPTMDALLADLERSTGQGRRRLLWVAATAGVVGLTAVAASSLGGSEGVTPCSGAEAKLGGVWDHARRKRMNTAFEATRLPYAEDARTTAERSLDAYTEDWVRLRTEVCEATRVRGDQSEALMDLRIGCLDGRLRKLNAMTAMLAEADADVVKNAAQGVQSLPPLEDCTTVDRDESGLLHPDDPELARRVEQVREDTAGAWARALAGKYDEAQEIMERVFEAAQETGYRPVIAEAGVTLGQIHERNMAGAPARDAYEEALYAAAASGHARSEALALTGMLSVLGTHLGDLPTALRYGNHAEAVIERLGNPPHLAASVALYRGNTLMGSSQLELALAQFRQALDLSDGVAAAQRTHLAALNNVAAVQGQQGRYREAIASFREAAERTEAQLGPWHPFVGQYHNNIGVTYVRLEEYESAMRHLTRALEIYGQTLSPDHPEIGRIHHNIGVVESSLEHIEASEVSYRKALEIKIKGLGPDHISVALSSNNVGDALTRLGRPAEGLPYIEDALRIWTRTQGEDGPGNVLGLISLSEAHLALGHMDRAETAIRRALSLAQSGELDPVEIAKADFVAARVIWAAGGDRAEARDLALRARQAYDDSERPSATEIARIDAWLADPQ